MKDQVNQSYGTVQIDLKRLLKALWKRAWIVCLTAIAGAVLASVYTIYMITPMYKSSAMFYVNNSSLSVGDATLSITSGDLNAAQKLVNTYIVILRSRTCLNDVIDYAGLDRSYGELRGMVSANAVSSTEIFEVVVTSADPVEAKKIANAIAYILPKQISSIVEGTSAKIVDYAVVPSSPSSPNRRKNTMLGFWVGALLSAGLIVVLEIFNITIRTENDVEQCCDYPILAAVPKIGGHYSAKQRGKSRHAGAHSKKKKAVGEVSAPVGKGISFAAAEAYKSLRTKLQFFFVDEISCPVIGVSSAMAGEGKSLSSVNLTDSLAQLDKRVLLIECDMRRPSIAAKLPVLKIPGHPGLSDYLTGQAGLDAVIQTCTVDAGKCFNIISSGSIPPNPIELLSSAKMSKLIGGLRESYDYIILDLPPVGEVSDAIVASKLTDGILLVVRQDYCNTVALKNAVQQFEFMKAKILGVVVNCASEKKAKYYYKKSSYAYSYAAAANQSRKKSPGNAEESDQSKE